MTFTELVDLVGGIAEESSAKMYRVSNFEQAEAACVVFAVDEATLLPALESRAGMILAPLAATASDGRVVRVKSPKYSFALCAKALREGDESDFVHASAVIHNTAWLGARVRVGAGAVVGARVVIGDDSQIESRAMLYNDIIVGSRVVVQAGAVLGSKGFGYVRDPESGQYVLFPQQGDLVIEDDVEIGANTTIDRGALGETRIGQGTKIDNLVHIGHNCRIGRNVLIAAQVGISGSCVVEDGAVLAGQVGLGDHVMIGPGVILGGAAGVFPHKYVEGPGQVFMGVPAEPLSRYLRTIAKLRRL